jgi:hypothetical protein
MAIRAVNSGASKIIILPVFITESTHTVAGQEMVASINPESFGVQVCYTGALWDSQPVLATFSSARFFGFLGRYFVSRFLIFSVQGGLGFFEYALGSFG